MTAPNCQNCKTRPGIYKGVGYRRGDKTPRVTVFICSECPKPKRAQGLRLRYHLAEWFAVPLFGKPKTEEVAPGLYRHTFKKP